MRTKFIRIVAAFRYLFIGLGLAVYALAFLTEALKPRSHRVSRRWPW